MNSLTLPRRNNGQPLSIGQNIKRVLIIGANGSGKTRFARAFANLAADNAVVLSALSAIYDRSKTEVSPLNHIDSIYASQLAGQQSGVTPPPTRLEKLFAILMHDEMANLLRYKMQRATDHDAELQTTILDRVIAIWGEIFPDNRILVESGKLLFSRGMDNQDPYSSLRLSTGEKATFYYIAALLYAPENSVVFIDNPDIFLHPSVLQTLWNRLETERSDCRFVYTTHDLEFAGSRSGAATIWVRDCDIASESWDYDILPPRQEIPDEVYMAILGSRKPIIFIEGDAEHSIDAKFYPLIFSEYTVKSMGSCNKVIEATRSFNDLASFHHLDSHGIVDRDRRDDKEVEYLRRKKIFVPNVAEIENILMLEEVVKTVATHCGKNEEKVFNRVKNTIITMFKSELRQQALQHTRHRMKRFMECRIDGRFADINMLEQHLSEVTREFNARGLYENYCRDFHRYAETDDYRNVLRVFNQKSMVPSSGVAGLCGMLGGKDQYVATVIELLRRGGDPAERIRQAVLNCFGIGSEEASATETAAETTPRTPSPRPVRPAPAEVERPRGDQPQQRGSDDNDFFTKPRKRRRRKPRNRSNYGNGSGHSKRKF